MSAPDPVPSGPLDGVEPVECPHPGAVVLASVGVDPDDGPVGVPLTLSANGPADLVAELAGLRAWLTIGQCPECHARVATVHLTDPDTREPRSPEDLAGRRGGTPWVTLA